MVKSTVLVTGCAGFIGFHLSLVLLKLGYSVVGVDSLSDYYDVQLKRDRLELLESAGLQFELIDLADTARVEDFFSRNHCRFVVHLAAQAGVRYSIVNPHIYVSANLQAFLNILEGCRKFKVEHLIYASSSSVYGANQGPVCSTADVTDRPVSLYGATKKANELMAHSYSWMYNIPVTGLRFFTVYGPWGRPDMALYLFAEAILENRPVELFNNGEMKRDFTYVDDVTEAISRLLERPPSAQPGQAPARVFNVGNNSPVELTTFLEYIEKALDKKAQRVMKPMQAGDVRTTCADATPLESFIGFRPNTPLETGITKALSWYVHYRRQRGL